MISSSFPSGRAAASSAAAAGGGGGRTAIFVSAFFQTTTNYHHRRHYPCHHQVGRGGILPTTSPPKFTTNKSHFLWLRPPTRPSFGTNSNINRNNIIRCYQQKRQDKEEEAGEEEPVSSSSSSSSTRTAIPSIFASSSSSSSWEASDWVIHVVIPKDDAPIKAIDAIRKALQQRQHQQKKKQKTPIPEHKKQQQQQQYTAEELLQLGSVWYMPARDMNNVYKKPSRLALEKEEDLGSNFLLEEGDYLRIHFDPRRFPAVDLYDWSLSTSNNSNNQKKAPVLVDYNPTKGYAVLNKPSECVPVHATVDNSYENIVSCLKRANPHILEYVTTPHRLDQNTSGLITLATNKTFASYYAQGLRLKTAAKVSSTTTTSTTTKINNNTIKARKEWEEEEGDRKSGIHKVYRCLVCLMPPLPPSSSEDKNTHNENESEENSNDDSVTTTANNWSVDKALKQLQTNALDGKILRHYLEPSIRAPKRFVSELPPNATLTTEVTKTSPTAGWAECLMKIVKVGDLCTLRGNAASETLAMRLWDNNKPNNNNNGELMPPTCQAVAELEVELLTGRTHQIRGQLSAYGYPLVNDLPYGGGVVVSAAQQQQQQQQLGQTKYQSRLALQCCRLEFLDPDIRTIETKRKGHINVSVKMVPSKRWNSYELDSAWWTPYLQEYKEALKKTSEEEMTTQAALDIGLLDTRPQRDEKKPVDIAVPAAELHPKGLPPQAILSPGRNKYVIVKAIDPNTGQIYKWFVKSASPKECGGPYHKDVARDLVEWIEACGYRAIVTGGGRILYYEDKKRALVYGFSYGFGRGDHALAAKVIKESSDGEMDSAYDDSPDLY